MWRDTLRWGRWSLEHTWSCPPPSSPAGVPPCALAPGLQQKAASKQRPTSRLHYLPIFPAAIWGPHLVFPAYVLAHASPPPPFHRRHRQAPGRSVYVPRHWLLINTWMWTGEGPAEGLDANRRQQDLQFKPLTDPLLLNPPTTHPPITTNATSSQPLCPETGTVTSVIEDRRMEGETQMWSHTLPHWPNTCTPSLLLISQSLRKSWLWFRNRIMTEMFSTRGRGVNPNMARRCEKSKIFTDIFSIIGALRVRGQRKLFDLNLLDSAHCVFVFSALCEHTGISTLIDIVFDINWNRTIGFLVIISLLTLTERPKTTTTILFKNVRF